MAKLTISNIARAGLYEYFVQLYKRKPLYISMILENTRKLVINIGN